MKKGWKIFWIVCASVAGIGVVLAVVGVIMGATFGSIQAAFWNYGHRAEQRFEAIEETVEVEDDFDEDEFLDGADWDDRASNAEVISNGSTVHLDGIRQLDVELSHLRIVLEESTGTELEFQTSNIPEDAAGELVLKQEGEELDVFIRNEQNWKAIMKNRGEVGTLTMRIPKNQLTQMSFSIAGGGVLEAAQVQTGELDIEVGAGLIQLQNVRVDALDLEVGAGDASVTGTINREASIDCGIGTVDLQLTGTQQDYSYSMECGAGVIQIGNDVYSGISNEKTIMNGGAMIEMECGAGEVTVGFSGR